MIELSEHIRTLFAAEIEAKIAVVDTMSDRIAQAGQRLVDCLLADGKIFICGYGGSAANCLHFSTAMLHYFEVERPSLPVINLASGAIVAGAADSAHVEHMFGQQIQALSRANDVVIVLSTTGQSKALAQVVRAAHDKSLTVIALTGRDGGMLANHVHASDIELRVHGESFARIREMHLFILHCFCDVIDRALFGSDPG